jgi:hypothetical protein
LSEHVKKAPRVPNGTYSARAIWTTRQRHPHPELQDGGALRTLHVGVEDDVPLGVNADDEALLVLVDLLEEALDGTARGYDHGLC